MENRIRKQLRKLGMPEMLIEREVREFKWQKANPLKGGESYE